MAKISDFGLLCFDVYGTLIDWNTGLLKAFHPVLDANKSDVTPQKVLDLFNEIEHEQQVRTPDMRYDQLLATVHAQVAERLGFPATSDEQNTAFGTSIGSWPAFPDTADALRRLGRHYKLVVLSNVDRESFAASNSGSMEGVKFDLILTAQDIGSYKPDLRNFEYMLREVEDKLGISKERVLVTAQSQFHDHHPAKKLGLKSVWIERSGGPVENKAREMHDWKFDTLGQMADALEQELKGSS